MSGVEISILANPFPFTLALLATHQGIPLSFSSQKSPEATLDGTSDRSISELEAELSARFSGDKGKETPLPALPAPFNAETPFPALPGIFNKLDDHLALRTYFAGHKIGAGDLQIWGTIKSSTRAIGLLKQNKHVHLSRWFNHVDALPATIAVVKGLFDAKSQSTKAAKQQADKAGTVSAELKNAVPGKVVVRFAPEPSGYLHIGHIKACVLNRFLADKYQGKMLLRFDDTNPEKEEDEFEDSFKSDLEMLGIKWEGVVHTSDHFDKIEKLARKLIEQGDAFMDDTDQMTVS